MNKLRHIAVCLLALFVVLGIPTIRYIDFSAAFSGDADAVTQATAELPEVPSGDFIVLINEEKHTDDETLGQWKTFFEGGDAGVILQDIDCRVARQDAAGIQLADRFRQRLPENQMILREQDGTMLASMVEENAFDIAIFSRELGDAYHIETVKDDDRVTWIEIRDTGEKEEE